jgi:hypothetical protein
MTVDESLLKKALGEAAKLDEAERQVLLTRADYHTAVRRLHLGGASLREVADALDMSHQRVQQIVGKAGGTWWQRAWGSRNHKRDAICTFWGRPPSEVAKLIAGPNVYICDGCVANAERAVAGSPHAGLLVLSKEALARCSFCGKRNRGDRRLAAAPNARVCGACLQTCREILSASAEPVT